MFQLAYVSNTRIPFHAADLAALALQSAEKNKQLRVTGFLNFRAEKFFQFLEGEKEVVLVLMDTIRDDERHQVVKEMQLGAFPGRLFPDWSMRYLTAYDVGEIEMEDILESTFRHMVGGPYEEEKIRAMILRMLGTIVAQRKRLSRVPFQEDG